MRRLLPAALLLLLLPASSSAATVDPVTAALRTVASAEYGIDAYDVGDLDRDGHDELATVYTYQWTAGWFGGAASVLEGPVPATGTPAAVAVPVPAGTDGLSNLGPAGDVNGDGYDDLLTSHTDVRGGPGALTSIVLGGPRLYALQPGFRITSGGREATLMKAGDVDGDGRDDLIAATGARTYVVFGRTSAADADLDHLGAGGFELLGNPLVTSPAGDFDGDGRDDLVVGDSVVFGRGGSTPLDAFATGNSVRVATNVAGDRSAALGDVNGDGLADVAIVHGGPGSVRIALGRRRGAAGSGWDITGAGQVAHAGDLNGDGRDDIATPSAIVYGKTATSAVDLATLGTAGLTFSASELEEDDGFSPTAPLAGVGDVTGDSRPDLMAGNHLISGSSLEPVRCTVTGTAKADTLTGTSGRDVICGAGGNDRINGLGGGDVVFGGAGADTIDAGPGNDYVLGGDGDDVVLGATGDDRLDGAGGNDRLDGGTGADWLAGQAGNDTLLAGAGADRMDGNAGTDKLDGGDDDDLGYGGLGSDTVRGGDGDDRMYGGRRYDGGDTGATDTVLGDEGDDDLKGGDGKGRVDGGNGEDVVFGPGDGAQLLGGAGNDSVYGGNGAQTISGGDGDDFVGSYEDGARDAVSCGLGADRADVDQADTVSADCETRV